jgi:hypothetical protein
MPLASVSGRVTDPAGESGGVLEDVVVIERIVCCCVLERESEAARCFQGEKDDYKKTVAC